MTDPGDALIRVLLVEDEDALRRMLARVLAKRGFEVIEAPDARTALALLAEHEVDIMLLDNGLPDRPGTEVLAEVRSTPSLATMPVILVTGRGDLADRVDGLEAGADDYLVKPVDLEELVARVRAQVRGRDAWRSQVQEALHERAALAGAIAAIRTTESPEQTAAELVGCLVQLPSVDHAAVVELLPAGEGRLLAHSGSGGAPSIGASIAPQAVAELRQSIRDEVETVQTAVSAAVFPATSGQVAVVGISGEERTVAVLLLEVAPGTGSARPVLQEVEAAVWDLLPVIERVLAPQLDHRHGVAAASSLISEIIAAEAFHPVFQPIVHLESGRVAGFEALTRFDDGARPDQRFADAARAGMGAAMELATMRAALSAATQLPADTYLSVNVSAAVLIEHDLSEMLTLAGERRLVLELTEHERIDDYGAVRRVVDALRPVVRLSVDDAGSGWASLRHVFALEPDYVKLDRGWVSGIDADPARQALLLGIARFVDAMDGAVVAEGIETSRELATLRSLDIQFGQGFLLGRPARVDEVAGV